MAQFATVIARTGHVEAIRERLSSSIMIGALVIPVAATEEEAIEIATEGFTQDAARLDLDFEFSVSTYEITEGDEVIGWEAEA